MWKLPLGHGYCVARQSDVALIRLLGGVRDEDVAFTRDQVKNLGRFYGFVPETREPMQFMVAGANRNLMRHVTREGRRIMGVLSSFLQEDEDPVQLVVKLLINAGYDIQPEENEELE